MTGRSANVFWPGSALLLAPLLRVSWSLGPPECRWARGRHESFADGSSSASWSLARYMHPCARSPRAASFPTSHRVACFSQLALVLVLFASPALLLRRLRTVDEPCLRPPGLRPLSPRRFSVGQTGTPERPRRLVAAGGSSSWSAPERRDGALFSLVLFVLPAKPDQKGVPVAFLLLRRFAGCALPLLLGVLPILALNPLPLRRGLRREGRG